MGKTRRSQRARPELRVGTSGWIYEHWRGRFYPESLSQREWFQHYASVFDTVEINNTFYQLPEPETFDLWRTQAPAGFVFAVKANRFLTHQKKLKDVADPLDRFLQRARRLQQHLGPILYQLPPRWRRNTTRLEEFCSLLPTDLTHVFEFRDPSWLCEETFDVLEHFGAALCIHDLVDNHPRRVTARVVYVRFHGAGEVYAGSYPKRALRRWAAWLKEQLDAGRSVYAYFNNDAHANAVYNALTLRQLIEEGG